jgi:hypothetical protein
LGSVLCSIHIDKSNNHAIISELKSVRDSKKVYRIEQWSDEDFEPIFKAIDGMFKTLGWIQ